MTCRFGRYARGVKGAQRGLRCLGDRRSSSRWRRSRETRRLSQCRSSFGAPAFLPFSLAVPIVHGHVCSFSVLWGGRHGLGKTTEVTQRSNVWERLMHLPSKEPEGPFRSAPLLSEYPSSVNGRIAAIIASHLRDEFSFEGPKIVDLGSTGLHQTNSAPLLQSSRLENLENMRLERTILALTRWRFRFQVATVHIQVITILSQQLNF